VPARKHNRRRTFISSKPKPADTKRKFSNEKANTRLGTQLARRSWSADLSYFGHGLLGSWPQGDIGIVLWSLAVAAWDWQTPGRLSRLCAVPTVEVVEPGIWDRGSLVFEAHVLRPLFWFGLLERSAEKPKRMNWSKCISIGNRRCSTAS
jgi:hypothetical protein